MVIIPCLIDLAPKLMFTVLYSSCSDDCDMQPECSEADSECEENQTDDNFSGFSELMQADLSPDDRPRPVIYLVTAVMWVR